MLYIVSRIALTIVLLWTVWEADRLYRLSIRMRLRDCVERRRKYWMTTVLTVLRAACVIAGLWA
jgi:hypothetical protein